MHNMKTVMCDMFLLNEQCPLYVFIRCIFSPHCEASVFITTMFVINSRSKPGSSFILKLNNRDLSRSKGFHRVVPKIF